MTTVTFPFKIVNGPASQLRREYEAQGVLFQAQPSLVQRFLEGQARNLADALVQHGAQVRFTLPEQVVVETGKNGTERVKQVPAERREQAAGGFFDRLGSGSHSVVRERLAELEQSLDEAVAVSAGLLRYATARYMVHHLLPSGRSVTYAPVEGEEIPTIPVGDEQEPDSAISAKTDAISPLEGTDENQARREKGEGRGELLVPYVLAARRFYLPQWVAFDDQGRMLVNTDVEAEAHLGSMQRFIEILHAAVALAPYMVASQDYQQKRYGMLGQLINQGRALALHETGEIIETVKQRARAHKLDRGLRLSLPFFDDQTLQLRTYELEVIPAGRIMFIPAFVVRAAREAQVKVAQDTRLSPSTRKYLLIELRTLENAFHSTNGYHT